MQPSPVVYNGFSTPRDFAPSHSVRPGDREIIPRGRDETAGPNPPTRGRGAQSFLTPAPLIAPDWPPRGHKQVGTFFLLPRGVAIATVRTCAQTEARQQGREGKKMQRVPPVLHPPS